MYLGMQIACANNVIKATKENRSDNSIVIANNSSLTLNGLSVRKSGRFHGVSNVAVVVSKVRVIRYIFPEYSIYRKVLMTLVYLRDCRTNNLFSLKIVITVCKVFVTTAMVSQESCIHFLLVNFQKCQQSC